MKLFRCINRIIPETVVKKAGAYVRELSIVVVGIAITLSLNNRLATSSERKDTALYLDAVKLELETNLEAINLTTEMVEEEVRYSRYLLSCDKNALDPDSIRLYARNCYVVSSKSFTSDAFEMFKISGNMRFITDKDVLLSVWKAYAFLEEHKEMWEVHHNKYKLEETTKELKLMREGKPVAVPMYEFYASPIEYTTNMLYNCNDVAWMLKEAAAKITSVREKR
ncbi:MAG: hypothetical protein LBP64_09605 [Tannerella sp.]|nr:hypothetical protein [Tannerella sp.]